METELNLQSEDGERTPTLLCAKMGSTRCMQVLMEMRASGHRLDIDRPNVRGDTPVHLAADEGHAECLALLIDSNAKLDEKNNDWQTAVWLATQSGEVECLELLVVSIRCLLPQRHACSDKRSRPHVHSAPRPTFARLLSRATSRTLYLGGSAAASG